MENKEELEQFNGLGADEKDKKTGIAVEDNEILKSLDLNGDGVVTQEELDIAEKRIKEIVNAKDNPYGESFIKAYNNLSQEDKDNISEEDINALKEKGEIKNESVKKLQEERKKILKDEEEELFEKFHNSLGGDMSKNAKHFQEIKRGLIIGLIFGLPGVMFVAIKDTLDKNKIENNFNEAIKEYAENGDKANFKGAVDTANKYFGKILDIKALENTIIASGIFENLDGNAEEIEKTIKSCKTTIKENDEKVKKMLEEAVFEEETEVEEVEEEDDPAPVEGMKFM